MNDHLSENIEDPFWGLREKMSLISLLAPHPDLLFKEAITAPGGLSRELHPILVVPDNGRLNTLTEQEISCLLSYYAKIHTAMEQKRGFIIIVDRRNDTWPAVRTTLTHLKDYFPSRIEVVFCLEPNGLLQKTIGAGYKQVNCYSFPVRLLQKPEELYDKSTEEQSLIPSDQLPPSLGGPLLYDHAVWCEQRLAVEKYEMNACELDAESTDLMDTMRNTELPNESDAVDELIKEQLILRKHLKTDIEEGIQRGNALQECVLQFDKAIVVNLERIPDRMRNLLIIRECMERLTLVEKQFDNFWSDYYPTLLQCQQLRKFEAKFRALWPKLNDRLSALLRLHEKMENHIDTVKAEELADILTDIEEITPQAKDVLAMGHRLVSKEHYADDSIRPKCKELDKVISDLETKAKYCEEKLQRCTELEERMHKAEKWCTEGMDKLSSQWMITSNSDAQTLIRDIDQFLSEAKIFKLDNPKEFHDLFRHYASDEMQARLPELLKELEEIRDLCLSRKVQLGWKEEINPKNLSSLGLSTSRPIRAGSR